MCLLCGYRLIVCLVWLFMLLFDCGLLFGCFADDCFVVLLFVCVLGDWGVALFGFCSFVFLVWLFCVILVAL